MSSRRKFLGSSLLGYVGLAASPEIFSASCTSRPSGRALVVSTWGDNQPANETAWKIINERGAALDAVVAGVQIPEADPKDQSVGYGGLPDRDGRVTLDSCVMDHTGRCGAVMCLEHIMHPVVVARMVMEKTPHVQLVGEGALRFALAQGLKKQNLLTPESEAAWKKWLQTSNYDPMTTPKSVMDKQDDHPWPVSKINHDTIGMVAMDHSGNISGACTTSGLAYKMHGRVGDSPIIGAGLFVDNEIGAATSSGVGEEVVKICGSHTIIESMRHGKSPADACKEAVRRIIRNNGETKSKGLQVGFLAINKNGEHGGFATIKGFSYVVTDSKGSKIFQAPSWF